MKKAFEALKLALILLTIWFFARFIFDEVRFLGPVRFVTWCMIGLSLFNLLFDLGRNIYRKTNYFSVAALASVIWFSFLAFMDIYALLLHDKSGSGSGFLISVSAISIIISLGYFYSSFKNLFKFTRELKIQPYTLITLTFGVVIFVGAVLMVIPLSQAPGKAPISFLDALFTSASCVCVTGLAVFDVGSQFNRFGQGVMLLLIEIGGLGLMTFTAFFSVLIGEKFSLYGKWAVSNAVSADDVSSMARFVASIVIATLVIETIGAGLLFIVFSKTLPLGDAAWFSFFHSISAFCNAGFGLYPDSLMRFRGSGIVNFTVMTLIILGGIGFGVISNVRRFAFRREAMLTLHTKIVLTMTAILLVSGAALFFFLERTGVLNGLPVKDTVLATMFSSVTPRTAGFNTLDYGQMRDPTLYFTCILMFIGASPGSTGGGIKTTTFFVVLLNTINILRDRLVVQTFHREIPFDIIRKALVILLLALGWVIAATFALSLTEKQPFIRLMFEEFSAFGTVGLSTGITASLTPAGKIILILSMFLGRVGPMTLMFSLGVSAKKVLVRKPEEKITVG